VPGWRRPSETTDGSGDQALSTRGHGAEIAVQWARLTVARTDSPGACGGASDRQERRRGAYERLVNEGFSIMKKPAVVITHPVPPEVVSLLRRSCRVFVNDSPKAWPRRALFLHSLHADALMTRDAREVDRDMLDACRRLRVVAANSACGMRTVDLDAFTDRGVWLTSVDPRQFNGSRSPADADMVLACSILQALSGDIPHQAVNQFSMIQMMAGHAVSSATDARSGRCRATRPAPVQGG